MDQADKTYSTKISKERTAIILAAGRASRNRTVSQNSFKFMLPLFDMPLGIKIVLKLYAQGIKKFVIVISPAHKDVWENFLKNFLHDLGVDIHLQVQTSQKGPGDALAEGMKIITTGEVSLFLADTLIEDNLDFTGDWVAVAKEKGVGDWCWADVNEDSKVIKFYDKVTPPKNCDLVVCGAYQFSDANLLKSAIQSAQTKNITISNEFQLSTILEEYSKTLAFNAKKITHWLDFGTTENYQKNIIRTICSNKDAHEIRYIDGGLLYKKSTPAQSTKYELDWYKALNKKSAIAPRIIEHDHDHYTMEFIDLPTLSYIYHYQQIPEQDHPYILSSLINFMQQNVWNNLEDCKKPTPVEQEKTSLYMYIEKIEKRIDKWLENNPWDLEKNIEINGTTMPSLKEILKLLYNHSLGLTAGTQWGLIHGDLNFSNILYSSHLNYFRLIDPRGVFGYLPAINGGDIQYEYAKLRHSYHGLYEMFASDLYEVNSTASGIFDLRHPSKDKKIIDDMDAVISKQCDINNIKLLELGLFLSMLPFHEGQKGRDKALLLRAYQLANEILSA